MNQTQTTDAEMMARVRQQDRNALEILYDLHAGNALGLAIKILNERTIAEDVVQEAFWRVWQNAASFDERKGRFLTWLLSIVRNLAIDELRRRHGQVLHFSALPPQQELVSPLDVPEQAWLNVLKGKVSVALAQLPEAQRAVIELAYFEGLTHHEIATRLDQPLGTIHTRMRLAVSKLKDTLAKLKQNAS